MVSRPKIIDRHRECTLSGTLFRHPREGKTHSGPTETRTRIAGFRVQSGNHYTMEPLKGRRQGVVLKPLLHDVKVSVLYSSV